MVAARDASYPDPVVVGVLEVAHDRGLPATGRSGSGIGGLAGHDLVGEVPVPRDLDPVTGRGTDPVPAHRHVRRTQRRRRGTQPVRVRAGLGLGGHTRNGRDQKREHGSRRKGQATHERGPL